MREDEACIIPMWARQLVMGPDAAGAGHRWATRERGSAEYVAYYETHQPVLEGLLRSGAHVLVACDPERSEYLPGAPAVIHAWSVVSGDVVYGGRHQARRCAGQGSARSSHGSCSATRSIARCGPCSTFATCACLRTGAASAAGAPCCARCRSGRSAEDAVFLRRAAHPRPRARAVGAESEERGCVILDEHSYWPEDVIRISATDGHSDDSRCTGTHARVRRDHLLRAAFEHEPKLTPFAALLAEATR